MKNTPKASREDPYGYTVIVKTAFYKVEGPKIVSIIDLNKFDVADMRTEPLTIKTSEQMLIDFANVFDVKGLKDYLQLWGFPDLDIWEITSSEYPPRDIAILLKAASSLRWLLLLMECVQNDDKVLNLQNDVSIVSEDHIHHEKYGSHNYIKLQILPNKEHGINKVSNIRGEQFEPATFPTLESRWKKYRKEDLKALYQKQLASSVSHLMKDIHLSINDELEPVFKVKTPYQAMCLALFDQISGGSRIKKCPGRNCPKPFFIIQRGSDGRLGRNDRVYCRIQACRKWVLRNVGPVRKGRKANGRKT